jgi:hypothetical protein
MGINPVMAKEREHIVQGYVIDNFLGENLPNITLTLMTADSTVIAIDKTIDSPEYPQLSGHYSFKIRKTGRYIIKATSIGYEDGYMLTKCQTLCEHIKLMRIKLISVAKIVNFMQTTTVMVQKVC